MRPIRWLMPGAIWLVTNRTEQERFFFRPSETINTLIGGWLARALSEYGDGIELYGYVFLSNHFHILLRDNKGQLARFMWYFQTNLAKAINRELGRRGRIFSRRYDAELVDGEDEFFKRYAYVACNSVKAGLTERGLEWPGISSLEPVLSGVTPEYKVFDYTAYHNATRRKKGVDKSQFYKAYYINIACPPMWEGLSKSQRDKQVRKLIGNYEEKWQVERRKEGKRFLGARGILSQRPTSRPRESTFSPRVYVLCSDKERRKELLQGWREITWNYRERHEGFRLATQKQKRFIPEWPPWTCPPCSMEPTGYGKVA